MDQRPKYKMQNFTCRVTHSKDFTILDLAMISWIGNKRKQKKWNSWKFLKIVQKNHYQHGKMATEKQNICKPHI